MESVCLVIGWAGQGAGQGRQLEHRLRVVTSPPEQVLPIVTAGPWPCPRLSAPEQTVNHLREYGKMSEAGLADRG